MVKLDAVRIYRSLGRHIAGIVRVEVDAVHMDDMFCLLWIVQTFQVPYKCIG
jgi:hypothetical protein